MRGTDDENINMNNCNFNTLINRGPSKWNRFDRLDLFFKTATDSIAYCTSSFEVIPTSHLLSMVSDQLLNLLASLQSSAYLFVSSVSVTSATSQSPMLNMNFF